VPGGLAGPDGHSECLLGQISHFGRLHAIAMTTQNFEIFQKSAFGRILVLVFGIKYSKSNLIPT
jgi:hypothetical protein